MRISQQQLLQIFLYFGQLIEMREIPQPVRENIEKLLIQMRDQQSNELMELE
jgi:hypothetical protein